MWYRKTSPYSILMVYVSQDLLLTGGASAGGAKPRDEVVRELVTSTRREVEVLLSSDTPT